MVAFNPSVAFDIQMVKGGIFSKNALFGGEGWLVVGGSYDELQETIV